jgi:ubiquitination network signaling protein AcrB
MPPPKAKNSKHANRNEVGLAAPGRRVPTQKGSHNQLNGQANGKPGSSQSPPALPSPGLADSTTLGPKDHVAGPGGRERDRTASETSLEDAALTTEMGDGTLDSASVLPPGVEVQAAACAKAASRAGGTLSTVSTILTYYPLRDAISILILLLSLPPTLVLVIQTLFASLTFVPPTAGIATLPNLKELFNASNMAYPALATVLVIDLLFWLCWCAAPKPLQNIFLDISQAVVAISLSGAAATTGGPTYSIASCTLIVCVVHVLRFKAIHLTALDYLRSVLHKLDIGIQLGAPPFALSFLSPPPVERGWIFTVVRTILGIHIVSQGVTTCIRRSLLRNNEKDQQNIPAITKTDPEAAAGAEPSARLSVGTSDGLPATLTPPSTDQRVPGALPPHRDGKARESSSKKKKKQANQVRSQQPLWAAIASTKVTFVKEMEQREAQDDAREAAAMDTNTKPTFASSNILSTNRIWISEVRDTEVYFSVDLSYEAAQESCGSVEESISVNAAIDKSKPFFVRVNGAAWSSTRIMSSATGDEADGKPRYDGEIFGLAPLSSYHCEVVGIGTGEVLCSVSLITQATPSAEQAASAPAAPQQPALRPSSPITTLKSSIQSAEAKLNETLNRTRKSKKDQRGVHSDIRREINMLKAKLESSGGLDDKQQRRLMQINQHKTQAEEATAELKSQIEAFGEIPPEDLAQSETKRRSWQAAVNQKRAADEELENAKTEAEREISTLKSDISAAESKRERLVARKAQKEKELDSLRSKQEADMTAKQRRDYERAQVIESRKAEEDQLRFHIQSMEQEANACQAKAHEIYQQIVALQSWPHNAAPPPYPGYSSPPTPEGALPGTNGSLSPQVNGFPVLGPQAFNSPFNPTPIIAPPQPSRGRSSSMLSQYSGFTDDEPFVFQEPRHQNTWPMQLPSVAPALLDDRKESESGGSGSLTNGSTGSNSPRPDAKPFIPSSKVMSPIGPPSKANKDRTLPQSPSTDVSGR